MKDKRVHAFYSGMVQGVGFRLTARDIALGLNLTGWVRNLPDGRVELVAEGKDNELKGLLDKINDAFGQYTRDENITWEKPTGEFQDFEITR